MPTLEFKGKPFVYAHHLSVPFRELVIDAAKSLPGPGGPSLDDNLIIHGDNLEALKALLPRYAGKVDVIYIDPPYNTGNEGWAYNDAVNSPLIRQWLGKTVDGDDLERHDKWLCMMWPRLLLLKELLAPEGSLWISCDDNEVHHLRAIGAEIFGEDSLVGTVIWQKNYSPKSSAQQFSSDHDYILVFSPAPEEWRPQLLPRTAEQDAAYKNPDNDSRGPWKPGDFSARNPYSLGTYAITTPGGRLIAGPPAGNYWRYSEARLWELHAGNRIWWGEEGNNVPAIKRFLSEVKEGRVPQTLWFYEDVGHTQEAKKELTSIMQWESGDATFPSPKPTRLIDRVLAVGSHKTALILDSFAGSGTTAHSAIKANAQDGGSRRFILIETEDYADTLTAERVRRVIKGVPEGKDESLRSGLGGTFTYCDLGDSLDLERFFDGETRPSWEQVARYVAFTATGETIAALPSEPPADWFVGEASGYRIHLLYKPDLAFMRSAHAAISANLADSIAKANSRGKPVLLYAAAAFVSQKELGRRGITFCQLPYAIHRLLGDGPPSQIAGGSAG